MSQNLNLEAVLFDLYGTLIDIKTDEYRQEVWDILSRFLYYQGVKVEAQTLKDSYFALVHSALHSSDEKYPEVNVLDIFIKILQDLGLKGSKEFFVDIVQLFRTLSMVNFGPFTDTLSTLEALRGSFKLGLVSNAQRIFLETEMKMAGLDAMLDVVIVSSDHGFSKPDPRLMAMAVESLGVAADKAVYVGDNSFRDICGAKEAGLHAVLIDRGGSQEEAQSCDPDRVFSTLHEFRVWLLAKH
jgi:putative hydrolase of the HAD superfamily